jgi:hypothetical protein
MAIVYDLLTDTSAQYPDFRYDLFIDLFGRHFLPFVDDDGLPRIGADISLSTYLAAATSAIIGTTAPTALVTQLAAVVAQSYSPGDDALLQSRLNAVMVTWGIRTENSDFPQRFEFVNDAQAMATLAAAVSSIEAGLNSWRGVPFALSEERAVLVSLAHEGYNLTTIMDTLVLDGNRADPWFDIRYVTSTPLASLDTEEVAQRYYQSAIFELYNDPNSVGFDEAADVGRAYTARRATALTYEDAFDPQDVGMGDPSLGGREQIASFLQPAITAVAAHYFAEVAHADELLFVSANGGTLNGDDPADSFNSAKNDEDLIVGSAVSDILSGGDANDVLLGLGGDDRLAGDAGDDNLYGGEGVDILLGGMGNDKLWGGGDTDTLQGGKGNDTYVLGGDSELDPDLGGNPNAVGEINTDKVVEAKQGGTDTVIAQINAGELNLRNVEKFKLDADVTGVLVVNLNEFDAFSLSGGNDELRLVINRLQKTPIDIKTGGGTDVVHIEFEPGVDPSQVLNGKGMTARFQFTDLTGDDTIDLTSIGIKKIFTERDHINNDKGFYLLAPGVKLDVMDGKHLEKTYNNYTDNWFVVKAGDDTPYGPEFIGNIDKGHFEI